MVSVNVGIVLNPSEMKAGKTKDGRPWVMGKKKEKYDEIIIWAHNPEEVDVEIVQEIKEIVSATKSAKKGTDDKWYPTYSVDAVLKPANLEGEQVGGFAKLDDMDIPF